MARACRFWLGVVSVLIGSGLAWGAPVAYRGPWTTASLSAPPTLQAADDAYAKKNYRQALTAYRTVAKRYPQSVWVPRVSLRIAWCHLRLKAFDEALVVLRVLLKGKPGTLWEARIQATLARIYWTQLPNYGYERNQALTYNREHRHGRYRYLYYQHRRWSIAHHDRARAAYLAFIAAPLLQRDLLRKSDDPRKEAIDNQLLLVDRLELFGGRLADPEPPHKRIAPATPGESYSLSWPERKRLLYLLDEVARLNRGRHDQHPNAFAGYRKAKFLAAYPVAATVAYIKQKAAAQRAYLKRHQSGGPSFTYPPYDPGAEYDPVVILKQVLVRYPRDAKRDLYLGVLGQVYVYQQRYVDARTIFRRFLREHPKSSYRDDVKRALHRLQKGVFSLSGRSTLFLGQTPSIAIRARNTRAVRFEAYALDLDAVFGSEARLQSPKAQFSNFRTMFGKLSSKRAFFKDLPRLRRVAKWRYVTRDQGDHRFTQGISALPLNKVGAYLIWAESAAHQSVHLVVITDIVVVTESSRGKVLIWVTDAQKGRPLQGVTVVAKETWYHNGAKTRYRKLVTDARGRATYQTLTPPDAYSSQVEVFAAQGRRYAFTQRMYLNHHGSAKNALYKVFSYTDRPLYRPGHTVRFKHVVRMYRDGKYANVPNVPCELRLYDRKWNVVYRSTKLTNAMGTVNGLVNLDSEAALGRYTLWIQVKGPSGFSTMTSAGKHVRVEAYKKPEFKVSVTPDSAIARPGVKLRAKISARYYFGGAVTHARVSYSIHRQVYTYWHSPPSAYDWLYGRGYGIIGQRPYVGRGALVRSGSGETDKAGDLIIALPTTKPDTKYDYRYTVQATVIDLSRRTIRGAGSVTVTRKPFFVSIYPNAGFYSPGDRVGLKLYALTPDHKPVAGRGTLTIERVIYEIAKKPRYEPLKTQALTMHDDGEAEIGTVLNEAGTYRLSVEVRSTDGAVSLARRVVIVATENFPGRRFRFTKLAITSKQRTTAQGGRIQLMVTSPVADATVWLSVTGGDEILLERLLRLKGTAARLSFPATDNLAPNFHVRAVLVADNRVHLSARELFVPPADKVLKVQLVPDKKVYRPRDKGTVRVRVTDVNGRPVRDAELSLAIFDSSLLYIQKETAGDIRAYYYQKRRFANLRQQHSGQIWSWLGESRSRLKAQRYKLGGLPTIYRRYFFYNMRFRGGGDFFGHRLMSGEDGLDRMQKNSEVTVVLATVTDSKDGDMPMQTPMGKVVMSGKRNITGRKGAIRRFFPDTALWQPVVKTDGDGRATVTLRYPDSLTTWAIRGVVVDSRTRVGYATASVVSSKPLIGRLETPRFLVEGDRVSVAAIAHNKTKRPLAVTLVLAVPPQLLKTSGALRRQLVLPPHSEKRIDFTMTVLKAGEATLTLAVVGDKLEDRLEKRVPIVIYGAPRMVTRSGVLRQSGTLRFAFQVPKARIKQRTRLTISLEPSLGGVLLSALPYLIAYPYGCVEQTMSRFLPAALVRKALNTAGIDLDAIAPLKAKATLGQPVSQQLTWWRSAVRSKQTLNRVIQAGLNRLYNFQHSDGGWSWWRSGESDPSMSAYVVMGLIEASNADVRVRPGVINRGLRYLAKQLDLAKPGPLRVYLGFVLSLKGKLRRGSLSRSFAKRDDLSPYARALLALALYRSGDVAMARLVVDNLADAAWVEAKNQTASFKPQRDYWHWYNDRVETVAWALRAFITIRPGHRLEHAFAKWLILNRRGNRWHHTRATAMAITALTRYLRRQKELTPDYQAEILLNGKLIKRVRVSPSNVLSLDGSLVIPASQIADGPLTVTVRMKGTGSLYASAFLTLFSKEASIRRSGNEIFVKRRYFKLIPTVTTRQTWYGKAQFRSYRRVPLPADAVVDPGDLIEVKIWVKSLNDYSYLIFEDFKPAGFEPFSLKSGYRFQHGLYYTIELRDRKAVFFVSRLGQGTQVLSYRLRAQIPGRFHALPHQAHAMYAPRIRANSANGRLRISAK